MTRRRLIPLLASAVLGLVLPAAGCGKPLTAMLIEFDTNIPMAQLPELVLQCGYGWDGRDATIGTSPSCETPFSRGPDGPGGARVCLPASFGLRVLPEDEGRSITLAFTNMAGTYRRIITFTPPAQQVRQLTVRIHSACLIDAPATVDRPCPSGTHCTLSDSCLQRDLTCGNSGECVSKEISADDLLTIPRTGPIDASPTLPVGGMCPLSSFGDAGVAEGGT